MDEFLTAILAATAGAGFTASVTGVVSLLASMREKRRNASSSESPVMVIPKNRQVVIEALSDIQDVRFKLNEIEADLKSIDESEGTGDATH